MRWSVEQRLAFVVGYGFVVAVVWLLNYLFANNGTTISHPDSWAELLDFLTLPIFRLAQCCAGNQRARSPSGISGTSRHR